MRGGSRAVPQAAAPGWFARAAELPVIEVSASHLSVTLVGLTIYLFVVHSFKLPIASVGIGIGLLGVLLQRRGFSFPLPLLFMGLWLIWCTALASQSVNPPKTATTILDFLKIFLIFFIAVNSAKTLSQLGVMSAIWVLLFSMYPARGTYLNFFAGVGTFGRYGWNFVFSNYNDLAAYTILVLGVSAFLLAGNFPRWLRLCALTSTLLLSLLIIITQSRGAFIALVLAFGLMIVRSRNRRRLLKIGIASTLLIGLAAPGSVWERMKRMKFLASTDTIGEADSSAEQRWILLQVAAAIAEDHPITGIGLGNYAEVHGLYAEQRQEWAFGRGNRDTHNMYLNLLAETGTPGLLLFMGMLGSVLWRSARTEKRLRARMPTQAEQLRILRFTLIAYLLAAIFGSFHRGAYLYIFIGILWSGTILFEEAFANLPAGAPSPGPAIQPQMSRRRWLQRRPVTRLAQG